MELIFDKSGADESVPNWPIDVMVFETRPSGLGRALDPRDRKVL